ncbi:hypothetical protein [Citrobacter freundii]|uniref:Uncharacterized protein n=1 Tax=Citrobacter freundii TaxID=546 RepID=A0A7G2IPN9_CITFR|nr:hypothetical protein [Citrobacter freundii]
MSSSYSAILQRYCRMAASSPYPPHEVSPFNKTAIKLSIHQ